MCGVHTIPPNLWLALVHTAFSSGWILTGLLLLLLPVILEANLKSCVLPEVLQFLPSVPLTLYFLVNTEFPGSRLTPPGLVRGCHLPLRWPQGPARRIPALSTVS